MKVMNHLLATIDFTIEPEVPNNTAQITATGPSAGDILGSIAALNDPVGFACFTAEMSGHLEINHDELFDVGISNAVNAALDQPLASNSELIAHLSDGVTLSISAPTVRLAIEAAASVAMPEHLLEVSGQIAFINA